MRLQYYNFLLFLSKYNWKKQNLSDVPKIAHSNNDKLIVGKH